MKKIIMMMPLVALFFCSCEKRESGEKAREMVVSGIVRVFMHEPGVYSFLVKQDNNKIGHLFIGKCCYGRKTNIYDDLPDGEAIRIRILCGHPGKPRTCKPIPIGFSSWKILSTSKLAIHLHPANEIVGAGWEQNNGVFGGRRGMTTVIE